MINKLTNNVIEYIFERVRLKFKNVSDEDLYSIEFSISPPQSTEIALHKDWKLVYGNKILKEYKFYFNNVDFKEISRSKR